MSAALLFAIQLICSCGYGVYAGMTMYHPFRQVRYWVILLSINFGLLILARLL